MRYWDGLEKNCWKTIGLISLLGQAHRALQLWEVWHSSTLQGCARVMNEKMSDFHQKIRRHHSQCFLFSFVHSCPSLHLDSLKYLQKRRQVENNMAKRAVRKDVLRVPAPTFCLRPMGPQVLRCERRVTKRGKKERSGKTLLL